MAQREPMALLWERSHDVLSSCVKTGVRFAPLPSPPHLFEEMPAIEPEDDLICQQAIGVNAIDKAGFNRIIDNFLSSNTPDHVKRSIDQERALERHILDSIELLVDHFLVARITEWFRSGLDPEVPDVDRWWWAISLFIGVCIQRPNAVINDGFHLIESIALASPPGYWQTKAGKGPHLLDWRGESDDVEDIQAHIDGGIAAAWVLDHVEKVEILPFYWWPEIINRSHLYVPLRMKERLDSAINNISMKNTLVECIPHLIIQDLEYSKIFIEKFLNKCESKEIPKLVSMAERISFHSIETSLLLIDYGFECGGDASVIAQGALSAIAIHDEQAFLSRVERAATHNEIRSRRRFVQSGLRILMQIDPEDSRNILTNCLIENDEVSKIRLQRFAIEMCEHNPTIRNELIKELTDNGIETDWLG